MATNIPPHNLREIVAACIALVETRVDKSKSLSDGQLFQLVPGPDFPTGATIMGTSGAKRLYMTGNGGVVMRAVTGIEQVSRRGAANSKPRTAIIVTELPYQVNKAALLEKIAQLVNEKKLEGVADLRDESDRDGIRVVLELKRDAVAAVVLNNLYKKTSLQTSFSGNFLALMGSQDDPSQAITPKRFTLRESLDCFLDFRFQTMRRKSAYQLKKVEARAHIVDGLLLSLNKIDEVIKVVRNAPDQSSARDSLMDEKGFLALTKDQADSVLKLQLGQLTRLNKDKLDSEKGDLETQRKELTTLLKVDEEVYKAMVEEFKEMDAKFGKERKTRIEPEEGEVDELDMIRNSRSGTLANRV
jgi:DNA gyrase subunit A